MPLHEFRKSGEFTLLVPVPVMQVRVMRMPVAQRGVLVLMGVRLTDRKIYPPQAAVRRMIWPFSLSPVPD